MALSHSPSIVTNGLIFQLDAANRRSYSGSGTTIYSLFSDTSGSLVNGTGFTSANSGSFLFDGTNDYADFSTYTPSANTINIWVKFNSLQYGPIVYVGNDSYASGVWSWSFFFYNDVFYFRANPGNFADFYEVPPLGVWINYTLVRNNGSGQSLAYKNGVFFGTSSNSTLTNLYPNLRIAKASSTYASFNLSVVQIYDRALSATEIKQNFNASRDRYGV
jgi:hypothetical protein